jgi:hypothetical protein
MAIETGRPAVRGPSAVGEGPLRRAVSRNVLLLLVVGDVLGAGI